MEFFNPRRSFVILVLFSLLAFVTWSSIASIDTIVRANGRIVPAGKSQIVQHLEGGIVKKILVQEGEVVKAGQSLMELADVQARSSLGQEKTNLSSLRGREARLLAEATGQGKINFPKDLVDEEVKAAEIAAFNARRARLSEEARVLRDQSAQKRGDISEAGSLSLFGIKHLECGYGCKADIIPKTAHQTDIMSKPLSGKARVTGSTTQFPRTIALQI